MRMRVSLTKAGKKAKFPWNMVTYCVKNVIFFFTNFQNFLEEKDQNIYRNGKFHFKIANISLQKLNFPGMRLPNSTFCPCMNVMKHNDEMRKLFHGRNNR